MYRVYVLFDVKPDMLIKVLQVLVHKAGVIMADILAEQPAVLIVVQARSRRKLADLTIKAIASVENITEGMQLMPTRYIPQPKNKKRVVTIYNN